MTNKPDAHEIDAIAHFVEAVRELRRSPFFLEEYRDHSISWNPEVSNSEMKLKSPDENVLRGVLLPFRRVWLMSEPCYYRKVAKILKRRSPPHRAIVDHLMLDTSQPVRLATARLADVNLSIEDTINLWLNTKHFHGGASSKSGKFTRKDFERVRQDVSPITSKPTTSDRIKTNH